MSSKFLSTIELIKNRRQWMNDLYNFLSISSNQVNDSDQELAKSLFAKSRGKVNLAENETFQFEHLTKEEKVRWNRAKSRIYKTVLRYISMRLIENHSFKSILLAEFFYKNGVEKIGTNILSKEKRRLEKNGIDINDSLYQYLLSEMEVGYEKNNRKKAQGLVEMENNLDRFYVEKKLRCICEKINRSKITDEQYAKDNAFFSAIKEQIEDLNSNKIHLYYHLSFLLKEQDEQHHYEKIKQILLDSNIVIDQESLKELYTYLLNYCSTKTNNGFQKYANDYLVYIVKMQEKNLLLENKLLNIFHFKNYVNMALIANNPTLAWNFFRRYKGKLTVHENIASDGSKLKDMQNYIITLVESSILFYEEKYDECRVSLMSNQIKFDDFYHGLSFSILLLKLDFVDFKVRHKSKYNTDAFTTRIESLLRRIRRSGGKDNPKKVKVKIFLKALKYLSNDIHSEIEKMQGKIDILNWRWLNKMMNEIRKNNE